MAEHSVARKPRRHKTGIDQNPSEITQQIRSSCKYILHVVEGVYEPHELAEWEDPEWKKEHLVYDSDRKEHDFNDPPRTASSASLGQFEQVRQEPGLRGVIDASRGGIDGLLENLNHEDRFRQMDDIHTWIAGLSDKAAQESERLQHLEEAVDENDAAADIARDQAVQAEQAANDRRHKIVDFVQSLIGKGSAGNMALGAVAQRRRKMAQDRFVKARDDVLRAKIKNQEQLDELASLKKDVFTKLVDSNKEDEESRQRLQDLQKEVEVQRAQTAKLTAEAEAKQQRAHELKRLIESIRKSMDEGLDLDSSSEHPLAARLSIVMKRAEKNEEEIQSLCPGIEEAEIQALKDGLACKTLYHKTIDLEKLIKSREEVIGIITNVGEDKGDVSDPDDGSDDEDAKLDLEYIPDEDFKGELTRTILQLEETRQRLDVNARQRQETSTALDRYEELRHATRKHLSHLAARMVMDEAQFQQEEPCPRDADGPEGLLPSQWRKELESNWMESHRSAELYTMLMLAHSQGTSTSADVHSAIGDPALHHRNNSEQISFLNARRAKLVSQERNRPESFHAILRDAEGHWAHLLNLESSLTPQWQNIEQAERLQGLVARADPRHLCLDEDQESRSRMSSMNEEQQNLIKEANDAILKLSREARIEQVAQLAGGLLQSKKRATEINVGRPPPAPSPTLRPDMHGRKQER